MVSAANSFGLMAGGLGTATGRVPAAEAARQMALAYHYSQHPPQAINWHSAAARHHRIRGG